MRKQNKRKIWALSVIVALSLNITAYAVIDDVKISYEEYQASQIEKA